MPTMLPRNNHEAEPLCIDLAFKLDISAVFRVNTDCFATNLNYFQSVAMQSYLNSMKIENMKIATIIKVYTKLQLVFFKISKCQAGP